jgi:hypothetical protein
MNCSCREGFFEKNTSDCGICDFKCKTCSINGTNCEICIELNTRNLTSLPNKCDCINNYF